MHVFLYCLTFDDSLDILSLFLFSFFSVHMQTCTCTGQLSTVLSVFDLFALQTFAVLCALIIRTNKSAAIENREGWEKGEIDGVSGGSWRFCAQCSITWKI